MYEVIFRGAHVIDPLNGVDGVFDVAVEDGKIAELTPTIIGKAAVEYDFSGRVLQPGIVDSHVHLGSMWGSFFGHRMLAMQGVTTCLDMAGPLDDILDNIPQYGSGLNIASLQYASPSFTFASESPSEKEIVDLVEKSLLEGALGVKVLGGPYPLTPQASAMVVKTALSRRCHISWHAGTTVHGSNIEGVVEVINELGNCPLHLAHINAYCRGGIKPEIEETKMVIDMLLANPDIICESYVSPRNGTRLTCGPDGKVLSKVTQTCLTRYGFSADIEGVKKAFLAKHAWAVYDAGGYSDLMTGEEAIKYWEANKTDVGGSFNVNPPLPRVWLAEAKRPDGSFVVDAISTDGGCIPRNVILSQGLSLVKLGILTLPEFVVKTSLNPARMLRLANKGHLTVGADADITVYDYDTQKPLAAFVEGAPIMLNGEVLGKNAQIICTERGVKAIEARGMKAIAVDPGVQYGPRYVLKK